MARLLRILLVLVLSPAALAAVAGWYSAPGFLHPQKRVFTPDMVREADLVFAHIGSKREDLAVQAPDRALLCGWKVRAPRPNGAWVLAFHGVADNRYGMTSHARMLLEAGYGVVMMDQRAHGASGGAMASYGWLERKDASAVVDALVRAEHPAHVFALGNSMGAGIALESAGEDPRIEAVVAEAPFADLQEAAYDYAGLQRWPALGKTLFAPGAWTVVYRGEKLAGFPGKQVSSLEAVGRRAFPVLLVCDGADLVLPCRHSEKIFEAATGEKELWRVPAAPHTGALGTAPDEYRRRVIGFFDRERLKPSGPGRPALRKPD